MTLERGRNTTTERSLEATLYDVAIVGCGPVGATLANLLGQRGLTVLVLDREADIYPLPRAIAFDAECMRVFQTLGIVDVLRPHLLVSPGMKFVDAKGRVLIDWSRPVDVGPQGWHPSYRFHQPELERALRQRLTAWPKVDVRLRHDVFALDEREDHVQLRLERLVDGSLHRSRARYVIGCDGARSLVRRLMDSTLEDLHSHERWLVLDVLLKRERPDLGDHSIQFCDPVRPSTYVRGVGRRRRWELMLMPGDDAATIMRPESVWPLLSRWLEPAEAELERPALYTFHAVVAKGWRKRRSLIAGDAAHQTPPFMGQGMCAGIRDAANLGWKLADVVRGAAPERLLDSYESERAPHAREFIETAVRLGAVIQATDAEAVRLRDEQMASNPQIFATPQPPLGSGAHVDDELGGRVARQPRLADGTLLDERIGYGHGVLAAPDWTTAAATALALSHPEVVVVSADSALAQAWLQEAGARAIWLRPDRYVGGAASDARALFELAQRCAPRKMR
ncbi:MAG: bifunctional 3-(3-hydroxy-phenyl)propionate/3-hydroxycinnamic acid hydroxylase [Variovorax sp.]